MKDKHSLIVLFKIFAFFYFFPFAILELPQPIMESLLMAQDYAGEHVLLCLIHVFFIAGVIANFLSQETSLNILEQRSIKLSVTQLTQFRELSWQFAHAQSCLFLSEFINAEQGLVRLLPFHNRAPL